ncbi:MAG: biotin/lipoyl-binding protein [Gemmataceae bacterium]
MAPDVASFDLARRKLLRLRLRHDLVISKQAYDSATFYVVKDPVSLQYFRFDEYDHFLLERMDGNHTLEDIQKLFEEKFRPRRLRLEDLEGLGQRLLQAGLVYNDYPQAGQQLWERRKKRRGREILQKLTNILYIQFPLFDPDPLLGRLLPGLRWMFTRWFFFASVAFMLYALLFVGMHWNAIYNRLPSYQEFFSFKYFIQLWIALGLVKIIHEFGHGLTCKAMGGECHDMGGLLMCLSPCLYMNVSDAWTMPDKWKRILVGVAGIYVELMIAGIATFLWWNTPGWPMVNNLALSLMIVCSLNTVLFNGNPLLRFDGYYVLADWLEIPNLRERANSYLKRVVQKHCLGMEVPPEPTMSLRRRVLFVVYAIASYLYGWIITFSVLYFMSQWLKPYKLGVVSAMLAAYAALSMVGWPLWNLIKGLRQRGKLPTMKPKRVSISLAALAFVVALFFLLPLPVSRVRQTALVQIRPEAQQKVFVPLPGILTKLHVRDGQFVEQGDILAEFTNHELETQLEEARTQHTLRLVRLDALSRQWNATNDAQQREQLESAIAEADGERKFYAGQVDQSQKQIEMLVVHAPRAGIVLAPPRREEVGKLWEKEEGTPLCSIGDPTKLRVLVPVIPADQRILKEDLEEHNIPVTIRVQGWAERTWPGKIAELPESEAQDVPVGLTTRGGGPLAVKPGSKPNAYVPQDQHFLVAIDVLDAEQAGICPGSLAQVKIHCRYRSCAWWVWREISLTFDLGLI